MKRIFVPTTGIEDWKRLLAAPERQWRSGASARSLAACWETAHGFPPEIVHLFAASGLPAFQSVELLLALPEYKVPLLGRGGASQNDLFVLARSGDGELMTIMVEGKLAEPFGETVGQWLAKPSPGKQARLAFLLKQLGLAYEPPGHIRYQLLHRVVSARIEAARFNARYAVMLVHSFSQQNQWFEDYQQFLGLFGHQGAVNMLTLLNEVQGIKLMCGWAKGDEKFLQA